MAGRRPTPTNLKVVRGNPGKRPLNDREPNPVKGIPTPPKHLSPKAAIAWERLGSLLGRMGIMTHADGFALERLCEVYSAILDCEETIQEQGRYQLVTTQSGDKMERLRPAVTDLADLDRRFKSLLVEFGLTPAARSKVKIESGQEKDPLDDYFA